VARLAAGERCCFQRTSAFGCPPRRGDGPRAGAAHFARMSEPATSGDGILEWRDADGRLDRRDGPARVLPSGREEWYRHGRLHRDDGPAIVHANGSEKWYVDGRRHRDDGPACVYVNGTRKWYRDGLRHRDDGPAAVYPDGRALWFHDGVRVAPPE
jgi:hypothetical protein